MENQIVQLSTSYRDLLLNLRDNTTSVFAANPDDEGYSDDNAADQTVDQNDPDEEQAELLEVDGNTDTLEPVQIEPTPATPEPEIYEEAAEPDTYEEPITASVEQQPERTMPETYTVQQGDNLSYISIKFYGTKDMVERIMDINEMSDDRIFYGKVLKLP